MLTQIKNLVGIRTTQWPGETAPSPLERVPDWVTLRNFGQSKVLALTMLVPFLGSLILFNDQLVTILKLTSSAVSGAPVDTAAATLHRLKLTYLGLVALGSGSFLFTVFCPSSVKRAASVGEYIASEEPLVTPARMRLLIDEVLQNYYDNISTDGSHFRISYPEWHSSFFTASVIEVIERMGLEGDREEGDPEQGFGPHGLWNYRGGIRIDRAAEILHHPPGALRSFPQHFAKVAFDSKIDFLALHYNDENMSRPALRIAIATLYVVGFFLLSIPTIATFIAIIGSIFG